MSLVKHSYKLADGTKKETTDWYYRFAYRGKIHFASTKTSNKTLAAKIEKKKYEEVLTKFELGITESITLKKAIANFLDSVTQSPEYNNTVTYTEKFLGAKKDNRCTAIETKYIKIFGLDGERLFESIKTTDIQQLVLARRKEGNKNGTILAELSMFSLMTKLNKALGHPVPNIDLAAIKKDNSIKPSKGRLRFLSKDEETRLLEQLHPDTIVNGVTGSPIESIVQNRQDIFDLVVFLLATGARYTEIAKIKWESIDMKSKTVNLYRNKTKNESIIHMTTRLYEVLERRIESKTGKFVFTCKDGGARKYSTGAFDSACKRAGIEGVTLHTLRHTTASRLVQKGVSLQEVQQILGHKSPSTTAIYAHLVPNQASKTAASILDSIDNQ